MTSWKGENEEVIEKIKVSGACVIQNDLPATGGPGNINYQLKSTLKGIELAQDLNYEYLLKTRTDQRLYRHDLFQYFISLINVFPLKKNKIQKNRLIVSSLKTCKYRLYSISDMLMFGTTNDILLYWNTEN